MRQDRRLRTGIVGGAAMFVAVLALAAWGQDTPAKSTQGAAKQPSARVSAPPTASSTANSANLIFFEAKVRPLLLASCVGCHGKESPQGGLRLDAQLTPEKAQEVLRRVKGEGGKPRMPLGATLPAPKIEALEQWVKEGAIWPAGQSTLVAPSLLDKGKNHWSFQPVRRPAVPTFPANSPANAWVQNPIDAFVWKRLAAAGLKPAPPATRRELIRRLSYDLTGLPPTPEEVAAFEADRDPNAYNKLVDRLLASPHYGEKWGRHWLDLVRYAETNSYERDNPKPNITRYRDYVIRAFNSDKPYDRFLKEQLAGDEMPDPNGDPLIATAYYRLGIWDDEPADPKQAESDDLDDLVVTTGQAFLGLTMDCARCHDHKFDPIPQKDYYKLVSFFQNINRFKNGGPTDEVSFFSSEQQKQEYTELEGQRKAKQEQIDGLERWYREHRKSLENPNDIADLHYRYYQGNFASLPNFDALTPVASGTLSPAFLDLRPRKRDTEFGFVFEGTLNVLKEGDYTFHMDSDDGGRLTVAGKMLIEKTGSGGQGMERQGKIHLTPGKVPFRVDYFQGGAQFGLSLAWSGPGFPRRPLTTYESCDDMGLPVLMAAELPLVLGAERLAQYNQWKKEKAELDKKESPVDKVLCVTETGPNAPDTFLLLRGNPTTPGEKVTPGFPLCLGGGDATVAAPTTGTRTTGRRTALANWIASPNNPLTARVIVNRIWQGHFGRGIVRTPNDFGLQGALPTHPELLDWLAAQFAGIGTPPRPSPQAEREKNLPPLAGGVAQQRGVPNPWSFKAMHRLILTSNTYKQSSRANSVALAKDPQNDLFWRFDMRRLTAEEMRDSLLAVSGTINLTMYGDSIYPEIPKEILAGQSRPGNDWYTEKMKPEDLNRRSIYIHVKRSLIYPLLASFDLPETDRTSPVRFASTQPTQALSMINGPFVNQQAALLAERVRREVGAEPRAFTRRVMSLTLQRPPTDAEVAEGVALMTRLQSRGAKPEKAQNYLCLMALNLDEFVYLD